MHVTIEETVQSDKITVLRIKGEIDVYTAPDLRERLLPLCEREQHTVVVDLSSVTYMDSTGLGVLIGAYKASKKAKGELVLKGMTPRVERLFRITGLYKLITVENPQVQGEEH